MELDLRSRLEDEGEVLAEMTDRLPRSGSAEPVLRRMIVDRYLKRKGWEEALELLGESPPAGTPEEIHKWYRSRITAYAGLGRTEELRSVFAEWRERGEDAAELEAAYAVVISVFQLEDPTSSTVDLLQRAVDTRDRLDDPELLAMVYRRLIGALVVAGRHGDALAYLDQASAEGIEMTGVSREDILRSRTQSVLGSEGARFEDGTVVFHRAGAGTGESLWLSPPETEPVDSPYEVHAIPPSGRFSISRQVGVAPVRWVLVDAAQRATSSGVVWPVPGVAVEVELPSDRPTERLTHASQRRPPDGRRRVMVALLDCGDWRLIQFGRARGELPMFDHLVSSGTRGVLLSDPPFTAVALEAITRPHQRGISSFLGFLFGLGTEAEALNFVGVNPFAFIDWVLPADDDIFTTLGAGEVVAANMIKSYGPIQVGRQSQIHGPHGVVRTAGGYQGSRELDPDEQRDFPAMASVERREDRSLIREMAADFDTLATFAGDPGVDLTVLRVASLDILTHAHFADEVRSGSSGGAGLLAEVYRYIDRRLAELDGAMDEDDLLIVMSDHGIRTALEHDRSSLFLAVGAGLPPGRLEGMPELRGLGRLLADLFGVDNDWPATGIERLAESLS
jgi:hypothetical protein